MRYRWLIGIGACAAVAFAVVTFPASIAARSIEKFGLRAESWSGSVWSGTARNFAVRGRLIGNVRWTLSPWPLLKAQVGGHATVSSSEARAESDFNVSKGGRATLRNVELELPAAALASLPGLVPRGWTVHARGRFDSLVLEGGWPISAVGTLDVLDVVAPPDRGGALGSYRLEFPDPSTASQTGSLHALVTTIDGPLQVRAQLRLTNDRSYEVQGLINRTGPISPDFARALEMLGPADSAGRRPFGLSGTF